MAREPIESVPPAPLVELYSALPADAVDLAGTPRVELPDNILRAVARADRTGYSPPAGIPELREAIATKHGVGVEQVIVTAGAMQALDLTFRLVVSGGTVLMPRPGFFIDEMVAAAGGRIGGIRRGDDDRPLWESAAAGGDSRAIYANTPVNPTGYVYDADDVAAVHRLAVDNDLWLVADEAHVHFVYTGEHRSLLTPEVADRTVLIRSFSKDYAIAGWRVGYAVVPDALAAPMTAMLERQTVATNTLGQAAALAALTGPQGWIAELTSNARERGARLAHALGTVPPAGGLALFPAVDDSLATAARLRELGIPAVPGEAFGTPGFVRVQFGGGPSAIDDAIARLDGSDWRR